MTNIIKDILKKMGITDTVNQDFKSWKGEYPKPNKFLPQLLTKEELEENRIPAYKPVNFK